MDKKPKATSPPRGMPGIIAAKNLARVEIALHCLVNLSELDDECSRHVREAEYQLRKVYGRMLEGLNRRSSP